MDGPHSCEKMVGTIDGEALHATVDAPDGVVSVQVTLVIV